MNDLSTEAFLTLRSHLYAGPGNPVQLDLRDKRNTQDNPFDEYIAEDVLDSIDGVETVKASALTSPDIVLYRPQKLAESSKGDIEGSLDTIVGVEVKKLERNKSGSVARPGGLDYNTTPPCGKVRVYDDRNRTLDIRAFYLFVCLEEASDGSSMVTAATLVDGNVINQDFGSAR